MIERVFRKSLEWSGKAYLLHFYDGLVHLGRPSDVLLPVELIERGVVRFEKGQPIDVSLAPDSTSARLLDPDDQTNDYQEESCT